MQQGSADPALGPAAFTSRGGQGRAADRKTRSALPRYRMLRWGKNYADEGAEAYEARFREARLRRLLSNARELGHQLAPLTA